MEKEIRITTSALGCILLILSLILLTYVVWNALCLATGKYSPLALNPSVVGYSLTLEEQVILGIIVQLSSYVLLVAIAGILMKNGVSIIKQSE
jgi:hypothetical protein